MSMDKLFVRKTSKTEQNFMSKKRQNQAHLVVVRIAGFLKIVETD